MERSPDEKRDILRRFIVDQDLKIARWAKDSGVDKNSIYNFLNEHSQSLDLRTYSKLARTAGVAVWRLTGEDPELPSPTSIWVVGEVQAGVFREAVEWDPSLWISVDVPVPERFRKKTKALRVRGNSMNVEYPDGSIATWIDILDFRAPLHEDHVLVYRHRNDDTIEATIKELVVVDGRQWLWPRSTDPEHQTPIDPLQPGDGIREIEIKGIILGSYRPRVT